MPAAQDKIVYLYFICNCIVESMACGFLALINYIFQMTGSWHGDLRCYKHKNLHVIFLFTCKVASGSPAVTPQTFANLLLHAICN